MDEIIESVNSAQGLLDRAEELRELSKTGCLKNNENFRKMCDLYHDMNEKKYGKSVHLLTVSIANLLLHAEDFRELVLRDEMRLVADVQKRLEDGVPRIKWEQPMWRILFLLAHGQAISISTDYFDEGLAPRKCLELVERIPFTESEILAPVLFELGKYWYALCYNYGSLFQSNRDQFWLALDKFNSTVSSSFGMLESYYDALLQLFSLLLLFPEDELVSTFEMVKNIMFMLKQQVNGWSEQVSSELYSPLDEYKIPQILQLLELYIQKSPISVREQAAPCFYGGDNCSVDLKEEILGLLDSSISCRQTRDDLANILMPLNLHIINTSEGGHEVTRLDPTASPADSIFSPPPGLSRDDSGANGSSRSTVSFSNSQETAVEENWSDEEKFAEAARIMEILKRLNELGVVKTAVP